MRWSFNLFFRSSNPIRASDIFDGMRGSDCSIENIGIEKTLFRLRKNARFGLWSEITPFDPPLRMHKNWPNLPCISNKCFSPSTFFCYASLSFFFYLLFYFFLVPPKLLHGHYVFLVSSCFLPYVIDYVIPPYFSLPFRYSPIQRY